MSAANALVTAPLPPKPVLQALLERLREGLLLFTEDGQVALANPAAQNLHVLVVFDHFQNRSPA